MASQFENPSFESLVDEQAVVQADKFQGRLLREYGHYILPGQELKEPRSSAVTDLLRDYSMDSERVTLKNVLAGLVLAKEGQQIHWVDMGGGRGLAMREVATDPVLGPKITMTNVDLFDFGIGDITNDEFEYLEKLAPGMTAEAAAPAFINANAENVVLPENPELITSVEVIQYLNNPLGAIANWYNQLADRGVLVISAEQDWSGWIRYAENPEGSVWPESTTEHLLETLAQNDIEFAVTNEPDWLGGRRGEERWDKFRILAIKKRQDTAIEVMKPVAKVMPNPWNFKSVNYENPDEGSSIIRVINPTATTLGNKSLELFMQS